MTSMLPPSPPTAAVGSAARDLRRWRGRVFVAAWVLYATYYLGRANISVAVPSLEKLLGGGEATARSVMLVGAILTATKLAYGFGQVVNGLLGDRFGPRRVGTAGLVLSAIANVAFGLFGSFPAFVGIWLVNGLFQAAGAPSRIKVLANWFSPRQRGRMMGLLGTDYVVGNVACWILSGFLLDTWGWRAVFVVPALMMLASALFFALRVRNAPEEVGLPTLEETERGTPALVGTTREDLHAGWGFVARQALLNPKVWIVGFAYFGVDLFRYGFLDWSFSYVTSQGAPISQAVLKTVMVPLFGAVGIIASGWLTDRIGGRRAPVISVMLFVSALAAWAFKSVPAGNIWLSMALLAGIGFFLYGPHLLMGATIAMDLGSRKASATASGLIDGLGYLGAATAGVGTAWARELGGWDAAFILWIGAALLAGCLMLLLWNYKTATDQVYL
jgi:sugar phosphate permease